MAGAAIFAVAFAVGAWVVAPLAAVQALGAWADAAPGRSASTRRVTVNPFTLTVSLHDVALAAPEASLAAERAVLDFGIASLLGRAVALDELALDGARLRIGEDRAPATVEPADALDLVPASPFAIARVALSRGRIEWVAERGAPLVLDGVTAQAFDVDNVADTPARFEIDAESAIGGVLRVDGELVLRERTADGRVVFENVDAAPLAARLFPSPSFTGASSGAASFEWRGDAGTWHLRDASLRTAGAVIEWADGGVLSAASLEAAGVAELGASAPVSGRVWIDTLALSEPRATIVLSAAHDSAENHALDAALAMLSAQREPAGDGSPDADANADANADTVVDTDTDTDTATRPLAIGAARIELVDGVLEIVDGGLAGVRPSVTALDVEAAVERVEGERAVSANVAARVGDGAARLRMRAGLGNASSSDVTLEMEGVAAGIFTPHAERLAGYTLEGGTVDAAIEYRISEDGVDGHARIVARGVAIEPAGQPEVQPDKEEGSEDEPGAEGRVEEGRAREGQGQAERAAEEPAGDMSIQLALALLEDARGAAETDFDFRSPRAAAGGTRIGEMLAAGVVARLRAVAGSPFDALGAAAGVEAAALAAVAFPAGGAEPSEPDTLDALAEALLARPRIGLRVPGVAHRVLDREALAAQQIELHVTLATAGPTLVARPQPVDFTSPRHRDVLDEFAGERLGDEQRETIASYFARTPDGRIAESDRTAYYRALFDALVENEVIPENGIERLGRYRARAIADALAARGVAQTRIEIAPAVVRSAGEGEGEGAVGRGGDPLSAAPSARVVEVPLEVRVLSAAGSAADPTPAAAR